MYLNTLEVTLTSRTKNPSYRLQINQGAFDILSIIFEFKLGTGWHISRFLAQKDKSKYLYFKLRRLWESELLESFKVYAGSITGMPLYYMLSKKGLTILAEQGMYDKTLIKNYPKAKTLLSWGLFKHEAEVIELASLEAMNISKSLSITFKGEMNSGGYDFRSDKNIEVFTPDYTATYTFDDEVVPVYTEFERTNKSKDALLRKIERYVQYLNREHREESILRFIFQTPRMEESFWLRLLSDKAYFLNTVKVVTTNILLFDNPTKFLEPIYASERTLRLTQNGRLSANITTRIKLFPYL